MHILKAVQFALLLFTSFMFYFIIIKKELIILTRNLSKISLLFIFLVLISLLGCTKKDEKTNSPITTTNNRELYFYTLPSPPKYKIVKDEKTIEKVLDYIEKGKKNEVEEDHMLAGWVMHIDIKNETHIRIIGNLLEVDDQFYEIDDDYTNGLKEIYNNIDSKEYNYDENN